MVRFAALLAGCLLSAGLTGSATAFPLNGYPDTGIRRLDYQSAVQRGEVPGRRQPAGAMLGLEAVDLRLLNHQQLDLPAADARLNAQLSGLFQQRADRYAAAVLDLSDPTQLRYAEYRGDLRQNVGSVGKVVAALGLLQALADLWPEDSSARERLLKDSRVQASDIVHWDRHEVRFWNPQQRRRAYRPLRVGDVGSLWEFLDWTLSASSNAAASVLMEQALLVAGFGHDYPPNSQQEKAFWRDRARLKKLYAQIFHRPLLDAGIDTAELRQGSLFTRTGKARVPATTSYATPRSLALLALRMEQGRLVDVFSSRVLKRLLYVTEKRIRYASHPRLNDAAVYFKSGSLYACRAEEGFVCKKYRGNRKNYMNSLALIESPAEQRQHHYAVALMSNVLRENSALAHQTLARHIHRLIEDYRR